MISTTERGGDRIVRKQCFCFFVMALLQVVGILVPQPGMEPAPPALETQSPNHWTTREAPRSSFIKNLSKLN